MSTPPDFERLARQYLDLWHDQMDRMAHDPETVDFFKRTVTMFTGGAASSSSAAAQDAKAPPSQEKDAQREGPGHGETQRHDGGTAERRHSATESVGAEASSPVSTDGTVVVSRLVERIATLEERIERLERRLATQSSDPDGTIVGK